MSEARKATMATNSSISGGASSDRRSGHRADRTNDHRPCHRSGKPQMSTKLVGKNAAINSKMAGTVIVGLVGSVARSTVKGRSSGYGTVGCHGGLPCFWHDALVLSSVIWSAIWSSEKRNYFFVLKQQFSIYIPSGPQANNNSCTSILCDYVLI